MANNISKYFPAGIAGKEILDFLGTYNMSTQAVAIDGSNAENIQTTGGGPVMLDGVLIPALAADAELDISADTTGDAAGTSIADGNSQYFAIMADEDGTLSVWVAGDAATSGSEVCKIPDYDPTTYCCIGTMVIANDSGSALVVGTTALTGDVTFHQMIGPVFPHPDNLDND